MLTPITDEVPERVSNRIAEIDRAYLLYCRAQASFVRLINRKLDAKEQGRMQDYEYFSCLCDAAHERFNKRFREFMDI